MAGLMRNLGRFVGEIGRAIRTPAGETARKRVTGSDRETVYTDSERITLTRTTTEEIRIEPLRESDDRRGDRP